MRFAGELTLAGGELARMRPEDEHLIGVECPNNLPITDAHLTDDPLRQATERIGAVISGKEVAEILPLTKRRRWYRSRATASEIKKLLSAFGCR